MNKKIKQLWDNSIEEFSKQHQYATIMLPAPLREKFAELIVQECIDTLSKRFMGDLNREDMEIRRCIEDVKKCFGVEECPNPNLIS